MAEAEIVKHGGVVPNTNNAVVTITADGCDYLYFVEALPRRYGRHSLIVISRDHRIKSVVGGA